MLCPEKGVVWQVTIVADRAPLMAHVPSRQAPERPGRDAVLDSLKQVLMGARGPLQVALYGSDSMYSCVPFLSHSFMYALHLGEMAVSEAVSLPCMCETAMVDALAGFSCQESRSSQSEESIAERGRSKNVSELARIYRVAATYERLVCGFLSEAQSSYSPLPFTILLSKRFWTRCTSGRGAYTGLLLPTPYSQGCGPR